MLLSTCILTAQDQKWVANFCCIPVHWTYLCSLEQSQVFRGFALRIPLNGTRLVVAATWAQICSCCTWRQAYHTATQVLKLSHHLYLHCLVYRVMHTAIAIKPLQPLVMHEHDCMMMRPAGGWADLRSTQMCPGPGCCCPEKLPLLWTVFRRPMPSHKACVLWVCMSKASAYSFSDKQGCSSHLQDKRQENYIVPASLADKMFSPSSGPTVYNLFHACI